MARRMDHTQRSAAQVEYIVFRQRERFRGRRLQPFRCVFQSPALRFVQAGLVRTFDCVNFIVRGMQVRPSVFRVAAAVIRVAVGVHKDNGKLRQGIGDFFQGTDAKPCVDQ